MPQNVNDVTGLIIDAAVKIHSALGPGLLESVYVGALAVELQKRGLGVQREVPIAAQWEGKDLGLGFRADLIVEGVVVVECKATEQNAKVHLRQLRTQVKLAKLKVGLLLNFGMSLMKEGIFRHVEGLEE